ncbi:hypothetical protein Hypma_006281 [Hypsizygus marmoreus]|uniref:Uncharacterized protein n=1 Tax=Hypsizygus marmoreus TaxID=39966 RepID=A0A369K374_HYPMA|nr:hypothetical protein Hypma_006281 [Hypsizygus marmoreus]
MARRPQLSICTDDDIFYSPSEHSCDTSGSDKSDGSLDAYSSPRYTIPVIPRIFSPCEVMHMSRSIFTTIFKPLIDPHLVPRSVPSSPKQSCTVINQYQGCGQRVGFAEGKSWGVGMLDILTFRDNLTDRYLPVSIVFGCRTSEIRLTDTLLDRVLPESSARYLFLPIKCPCHSGCRPEALTASRYQLALRVCYIYWLHQHLLHLPPFHTLRLISLHLPPNMDTWVAEIAVLYP